MARLSLEGSTFEQDWLSEDAKYPNEWFAFNTQVLHDDKYIFGNLLSVGNKMIMLSETGELI